MSNKLISVVIPAYNAEKTIQKSIKSVLLQDYSEIELIVVDDGSTDKTVRLVWEMRKLCSQRNIKMSLISQKNTGVSQARNRGFKEVTGDYVAFLDADDEWLPNKLSVHADHLDQSETIGLSFARVNFMSIEGGIRKSSKHSSNTIKPEDCLSSNPTISPSNWVVRKKAYQEINGFKVSMTHAEDQDFLIRLLKSTSFHIKGLDQVLVNYTTSEQGLSADIEAMYLGWLMLMESLQNEEGIVPLYSQHHSEYCLFLAKRATQVSAKTSMAWKYFVKVMFSKPSLILGQPIQLVSVFVGLLHHSQKTILQSFNAYCKAKLMSQTKEVKNV